MGKYSSTIITNAGQNLIAQCISGSGTIHFTGVQTSSYVYPEGTNLAELNDLTDPRQLALPTYAKVFHDNMIQISVRFDNEEVESPYLIQTLGVFARIGDSVPILFSVIQAVVPDKMPERSDVSPSAFIYNIQMTVRQAGSIFVMVNPSGTATVQDIMRLEEEKVNRDGGIVSKTITDVVTPEGQEKYPEIVRGTIESVLGSIKRFLESLKADKADTETVNKEFKKKVDVTGGDISATKIVTIDSNSASYPVPAAGDTAKGAIGKIKKFLEDIRNTATGACFIGQIVNNCVTNNAKLPLSAAQGKVLMDLCTKLNSEKADTSELNKLVTLGKLTITKNTAYVKFGDVWAVTYGRIVQISYYVSIAGCSAAYTEYPLFTVSETLRVNSYHTAIDQYTGSAYPVVVADGEKQIKLAVKGVIPSDTWIWGSIICFKN